MKKQRELDEMKNNNEKKIEEKNIIIAPKIEIKNIDENKEELKSDRMTIEIDYIDNTYGDDVVDFEVMGHKIVGVHGHKDKPGYCLRGAA